MFKLYYKDTTFIWLYNIFYKKLCIFVFLLVYTIIYIGKKRARINGLKILGHTKNKIKLIKIKYILQIYN